MEIKKVGKKVTVIVGEGGQVTIPIYIRREYKMKKGDMVVFEIIECVGEEE